MTATPPSDRVRALGRLHKVVELEGELGWGLVVKRPQGSLTIHVGARHCAEPFMGHEGEGLVLDWAVQGIRLAGNHDEATTLRGPLLATGSLASRTGRFKRDPARTMPDLVPVAE